MHSYVFMVHGESRLEGVYVTSDNLKNKKLYFVSLDNILSIYRLVGRDYPSKSEFIMNPITGKYEGKVW